MIGPASTRHPLCETITTINAEHKLKPNTMGYNNTILAYANDKKQQDAANIVEEMSLQQEQN